MWMFNGPLKTLEHVMLPWPLFSARMKVPSRLYPWLGGKCGGRIIVVVLWGVGGLVAVELCAML